MLMSGFAFGQPSIESVKKIGSPDSYESGSAYWAALVQYKLVNSSDEVAHQLLLQHDNFADYVKLGYQELNLFGSEQKELVVQLSFDGKSSYAHFFYADATNWYKTEYSLEYMALPDSPLDRTIKLSFREVHQEGEWVVLVNKTTKHAAQNALEKWLTIWQVNPDKLQVLHTEKIAAQSFVERYEAKLSWSNNFPKKLSVTSKGMTYKEQEETLYGEEVANQLEIATIEKLCAFESNTPCECAILSEETTTQLE